MIITILITVWITCGIIYCSKQLCSPFYDGLVMTLDFIFSPYLIISDIIYEWKENKELRLKYKN